ncbi:stress protein [Lysinibacillus sphaericus]|uniref:stress protein n=1 Tax=Lysinibacillus sphaericus TaxID=1421 RepID=UPI00296F0E8B
MPCQYAEGRDVAITADTIIQRIKAAGLEVGHVSNLENKEFGNVRKEGKRILIPSLGEDAGGRLFIFNSAEGLAQAKAYYDELGNIGPLFYSHTHQNGFVLLQMNGDMSDANFKKYADSLDKMMASKIAAVPTTSTTAQKPMPVKN